MKYFFLILALLTTIPALGAQPTRLLNDVVASGKLAPAVTGQDMNSSGLRWDFWVATLNTNLGAGVTYIDGSGNLAVNTSVTATELGYLDGVTSSIQTQLTAKQDTDAELTAIAGLTSAADKVPYFTGSGTAALATFTTAGRALVDDADASTQRTTLGLGTAAVQNVGAFAQVSNNLSDVTASTARTNLGLGTAAVQNVGAFAQVANNLSDVTAATARTNLGLAIGANVQAYSANLAALAALSTTGKIYYLSAANTWTAVTIGSGMDFTGGTLSSTAGSGTVYNWAGHGNTSGDAAWRFTAGGGMSSLSNSITSDTTNGLTVTAPGSTTLGITIASPPATGYVEVTASFGMIDAGNNVNRMQLNDGTTTCGGVLQYGASNVVPVTIVCQFPITSGVSKTFAAQLTSGSSTLDLYQGRSWWTVKYIH
jgi:hypothetical protein